MTSTSLRPDSGGYAENFAALYDTWFGKPAVTGPTVDSLAGLLGDLAACSPDPGPVLELGVGTGRVALPLRARGYDVHGVDGSREMVAQLRTKPGGDEMPVVFGDFADVPVDGPFSMVYLAGGTFAELPSQQRQSDCFMAAARRLRPGGLFVLDAYVPEALALAAGRGPQVTDGADGSLVVCHRSLDPSVQRYTSDYVITSMGSSRHLRVRFRYTGLGELDLMAAAAGLRLRERWGSWSGDRFTGASSYHVSVYELPE
ncbi:class I SAM-dependent DNA methyltransferase [Streptomyces sp. NPDC048650]|uniref:class I SAM-dependent DNA methyltransferase n=1 Tax=unclassified Streptomyces TaxID=2593676 RepID=UPI0037194A7C